MTKKADIDLKDLSVKSPIMAFTWKNEPNFPVAFTTPNVEELLGYSVSDFIDGKVEYCKLIHPQDYDRVMLEVSENSENKTMYDYVHEPYRLISKSGEVKWVYDSTHVIRDNVGNVIYYKGIVVDITNLKKAHEELAVSNKKIEIITDNISDMVWVMNRDGKFEFVTPSVRNFLGYSKDEFLSLSLENILSKETYSLVNTLFKKEFEQFLKEDSLSIKPYTFQARQLAKDGKSILSETVARFIKEGEYVKILGVTRDISDREKKYLDVETVFKVISSVIGGKDHYTGHHCGNVAQYLEDFARSRSLDEINIMSHRLIGILHDSGKIWVPDQVIQKQGSLNTKEKYQMNQHPQFSYELALKTEFTNVANSCRNHHERYDGLGYPRGINRDELSEEDLVTSIVDVYDALTTPRFYREKIIYSHDEAVSMMQQNVGKMFDPKVFDAFFSVIKKPINSLEYYTKNLDSFRPVQN